MNQELPNVQAGLPDDLMCLLTCMQVKKQQLEADMEQWTGSKLGKEYIKVVYCHSAYLTSMQSTSYGILGWMKHKLESRLPGEISTICKYPVCRWYHSNRIPLLIRVKEEDEKTGLKFNIQKLMNGKRGIWSYCFMANRRGNSGSSGIFCFGGLWKPLWMVKLMKLKDACPVEEEPWKTKTAY